jgi:hypothetical protein
MRSGRKGSRRDKDFEALLIVTTARTMNFQPVFQFRVLLESFVRQSLLEARYLPTESESGVKMQKDVTS